MPEDIVGEMWLTFAVMGLWSITYSVPRKHYVGGVGPRIRRIWFAALASHESFLILDGNSRRGGSIRIQEWVKTDKSGHAKAFDYKREIGKQTIKTCTSMSSFTVALNTKRSQTLFVARALLYFGGKGRRVAASATLVAHMRFGFEFVARTRHVQTMPLGVKHMKP